MILLPKAVVIAVGGNAAYPPTIKGLAEEQLALMDTMCEHFVKMIEAGYKPILTHGNGPVVGNILFRMARTARELPPMPMDVCVAHSQGGMGYMLQQTLRNVLLRHRIEAEVAAIVTEVEVDANDPAFDAPTKPVGRFISRDDAMALSEELGWQFIEDSGRGYRRVVPSPMPKRILGLAVLRALIERNVIPIVAGGGGIPVVRDQSREFHGVPAVIDKDLTSAMVAAAIGAEHFIMLTGVERVAIDFGKASQRYVDRLTVADARRNLKEGQFPPGSMGPKIEAALSYLQLGGTRALITSLDSAFDALAGRAGTRIEP
ncbi:MAG: carbamate kinase [Burkholderiales bacterium]|nr:carbamate kinase [Burkholderiales bacterium]